jgi:hypothetical protein
MNVSALCSNYSHGNRIKHLSLDAQVVSVWNVWNSISFYLQNNYGECIKMGWMDLFFN